MSIPRRQRRLAGRHALVDGIPFEMPIHSEQSPAFFAAFTIDVRRAAELLPGGEIHPLRVSPNRALLVLTVVDYQVSDIGAYIEFSIAIPCTHGPRPSMPLLPGMLQRLFNTGQYVLDLPVSTEISVKGGKGIWGMPKHQASLDFVVNEDELSSQYDLDGRMVLRLEIDRPDQFRLPVNLGAANYCSYRGMLMKSYVYVSGIVHTAFGRRSSARLILGDHPRADPLRELDMGSRPVLTGFIPRFGGVLDDHFEGWFLTYGRPVEERPEGLETVVDLGLGQEWPEPPRALR